MLRKRILTGAIFTLGLWLNLLGMIPPAAAQQPTVAVPTVTGTVSGPMVTPKEEETNVRAGPGRTYALVGVLVSGQKLPAIGRTPGGDWIMVRYLGAPDNVAWIYSAFVNLTPQVDLPIVEPPAKPTPLTTPTTDPTLAAQFVLDLPATRLPTFTAPSPMAIPTFSATAPQSATGLPMGFLIFGLGLVGLFGALISVLRGR
jgi:hypothetical protein